MNRYQNTEGIVINKKTRAESDLNITLLTPGFGKIFCLAKGVKNMKSSRLSALDLGNIIKVNLYSKNDFIWISEAKSVTSFLNQPKNLTQVNLLFYFLEIVNLTIAEGQSTDEIYPIIKRLIQSINRNQFRNFIEQEIKFVETLGFGIPPEITSAFSDNNLQNSQKLLKQYLESIIEKPLISNRLFK